MSNDTCSNVQGAISIVFFGRRCLFTAIPLARLLRAGVKVAAVVLSSSVPIGSAMRLRRYRPSISIGDVPASAERIAGEQGVPLYEVRRPLGAELRTVLERHSPDLLVASCFPWHIPASIRDAARLGGINLHPSVLPRYRGPDPFFWAFRTGDREWGVTVHQLCDSFDAGAILAQRDFAIADELPGDQLERHAAQLGGELLLDVVMRAKSQTLRGSVQDESVASYQTWPSANELIIDRNWSAQHVINFVVGVRALGYEPAFETTHGLRVIRSARLANEETRFEETWCDEHSVYVLFVDGTVEFTVA